MKILFNNKFLSHNPGSFAEGAYRIEAFLYKTEETDRDGEAYITLVHSEAYLDSVRDACFNNEVLAEVQLSSLSYAAARSAVGLSVMASEQGDFAVIRPPGHHAKTQRADGFCLFNNIAIATKKLVNEGKKVFILDIDGHHGDGTQQIFYRSNQVLFCSIHQQYTYPGTGSSDEKGEGPGKGYTMNYPLPAGSGDIELLEAVDTAIARAEEFKPDVVGVSAGFDGYREDRLLDLQYTLEGYYQCGKRLSQSFDHIFAVLEGGYHLDIKDCTEHFIRGVNEG
ncbi:MAG: histone deacetylase [Bacteroidota bacterium]